MKATQAAKRSSEQKIRRQPRCSGLNLEAKREIVIMGLPMGWG
jgi:hypothetical protein